MKKLREVKKDARTRSEFLDCASSLGKVYIQREKYPEAIAEFETGKRIIARKFGSDCVDWLCRGIAGDAAKGSRRAQELKTLLASQRYIPPSQLALVY